MSCVGYVCYNTTASTLCLCTPKISQLYSLECVYVDYMCRCYGSRVPGKRRVPRNGALQSKSEHLLPIVLLLLEVDKMGVFLRYLVQRGPRLLQLRVQLTVVLVQLG